MDNQSKHINKDVLILDTSFCKSFYNDNDISDFYQKNVCYLGVIGTYNGKIIIKFGKSCNMFKRDHQQHQKIFGAQFKIIHIVHTDNNMIVEN